MEVLQNLDLGTIVTIVLGLLTTFVGGFWLKAKGKISKVVALGKSAFDLLSELEHALDDNKITKDEIKKLKEDAEKVRESWKALVNKDK